MTTPSEVLTGVARLCAEPDLVAGKRVGLVTNHTGVLPDLRQNLTALLDAGVPLVALFGPEHGLRGTAQAGGSEAADLDPDSGLPVFDTYLKTGAALDRLLESSGIDVLMFDIQDIGTRFYTYVWTMFDCLLAAGRTGRRFVVLDRPNPIGGHVAAGPMLQPGFESFVGRAAIPVRHGLTAGELARHLNATLVPELLGSPVDLQVLAMTGWRRHTFGDQTGLPWVLPSPNIPTLDTALVYPGTGLFEGTNLSEGRGTTRPFEIIGAPYVDRRLAPALAERELPGVRFRFTTFSPTFHKYAGELLAGVQLHVYDRVAFDPVRTAVVMLAVLRELYPDDVDVVPRGGGVDNPGESYPLDRLWGSDSLRLALSTGVDPTTVLPDVKGPESWVAPGALLYD
ncbi:exo-beta-N-acetylmuramidase NamZ domain-containing protein [Actinopolymorpha alba]|uniref:exo-beta-N-acetylmuramidase NamZ family protein n=1 Tax=Actinopolymorpha alba TaxID=533267 RepID=UPI000363BD04|nr:DUF1343 domain-containing protein [Actinopolymorpha alba]